jgi:hypothetical protein
MASKRRGMGGRVSEWKWCQDCGHHYRAHLTKDGSDVPEDGPDLFCRMDGCECKQMAWDLADI